MTFGKDISKTCGSDKYEKERMKKNNYSIVSEPNKKSKTKHQKQAYYKQDPNTKSQISPVCNDFTIITASEWDCLIINALSHMHSE